MDMRIPPLIIKLMLASNPLKSIMLVRILAVAATRFKAPDAHADDPMDA